MTDDLTVLASRMGCAMQHSMRLFVVVLVIGLAAYGGWADVITVDGSDSDWSSPDTTNDDPDESTVTLQGYDIDYTYAEWDAANARIGFMTQTIEPCSQAYAADFVEFLINADENDSTGGSWHGATGADYRIYWDFDGTEYTAYNPTSGSSAPTLESWNSVTSSWQTVTGLGSNDLLIAWGDNGTGPDYSIIECTLNPTYIGMPDKFEWGCYLDNGDESADDGSPGTMDQRGYTPEPTTLALLPLGLMGLVAWRRRKRSAR